jgi:hypothetical protein
MSNIAATVSTTKMTTTSSATTSSYGGIEGLPLTFGVVLPESCCTSEATLISNTLGTCMYHYIFFHE